MQQGPSSSVQHETSTIKRPRAEPSFEEFLAEPEPQHEPFMPQNRPWKAQCYVHRDDHYFRALDNMLRGVVVQPPDTIISQNPLDQVAAAIAASGRVSPNQLQVATLSENKFLVLLPQSLNKDEIVAAIPARIWDEGFRFHTYSPLTDASISIPFFKLWIDIRGIPPELHQEMHMARAVSSFGLYLGSMEPQIHGDCRSWSIFMATDDLTQIPHRLELKVGGIVHTASVHPRKWVKGQIYHRFDLPQISHTYQPPSSQTTQALSPSTDN